MNVRCVITGRNSGKSIFLKDAPAEPITLSFLPGFEFHRVWGADSPHPGYFPPAGAFRFVFFSIPPGTSRIPENTDVPTVFTEIQSKLPGMVEVLEPMHLGMHTTDTVDFDLVLSGKVYLKLDDGAEVLLRAGDCVIQNGTCHDWQNRSSKDAVIAVAPIGAEHKR